MYAYCLLTFALVINIAKILLNRSSTLEIYGYIKQYILCKILLDKIENSANAK